MTRIGLFSPENRKFNLNCEKWFYKSLKPYAYDESEKTFC